MKPPDGMTLTLGAVIDGRVELRVEIDRWIPFALQLAIDIEEAIDDALILYGRGSE